MRKALLGTAAVVVCLAAATPARAEQLCDPAYQDCRAILLNLIRGETRGIDVAFWFMEDARYSAELIRRAQAGVPVRVLIDARAFAGHPVDKQIVDQLQSAGIPLRQRTASGILHWKMMLFAGQQQVEFSGANYSPDAMVYTDPYRNYVDEAVMFSDEAATVHSFMQRFDDLWTDRTSYADYANVPGTLTRTYPSYTIAPELNLPPLVSYRNRAVAAYKAEKTAIDVIMYRITDRAHTDAIIDAVNRGVRVRLITEQAEYRDASRLWDAWNVDRLYMAGVEIRQRAHAGLNHQKSIILRSQGMTIFGSSNWTSPSNQSQEEHNEFTTKAWVAKWFQNQFDRKWNNTGPAAETQPFTPLPPGVPVYSSPAQNASAGTAPVLTFDAGPFAHLYDIYLGTSATPPLVASDVPLGPTEPGGAPRTYQLPQLSPNTTYYWRIVAKTMALQTAAGPVWSFTTGAAAVNGTPEPYMSVDVPGPGATVRQPFLFAGWALDRGAASGNGVDAVHVYAFPLAGGSPIFLGAPPTGVARPDIGAMFGAQFGGAGYALAVRGLPPGGYRLVAYAHSTVTGTFPLFRTVDVTITSATLMSLDVPGSGATVAQGFWIGGWALDLGAASGGGVDVVHAYAYPLDWGGGAIFLGQAPVDVRRADLAAAFGAQFGSSGFSLVTPALSPGRYRLVVYAHSSVAGAFTAMRMIDVRVQ
jgi:phosphatidylserine/phosphatidylglycerophosphate/cardiolipin synthase-like enzyme